MSLFPAIAAAVPVLALAAISRSFAQAKSMESKLIAAGVPHETKDAHALWGVAHLMNDMPVTKVMEMMLKRHGDIVVFRGANKLWVLVTDPKIVQQILIKYNLPKGDYSSIEGLLGDSMLSSNGLKWTHKRKAISPAFRVSFLQNVVAPVVVERATLMMDVLFPQEPAGGSIDLQDIFSKITLDVIGIAAFEHDFGFTSSKVGNNSVSKMIRGVLEEPNLRQYDPFRPYYKIRESLEYNKQLKAFRALVRKVISDARKRMTDEGVSVSPTSILGLLLKNEELSDVELENEISLFLFAGHETTASTLTFMFILMHKNPETKAKIQKEVDEVLGGRVPTFEDIKNLRYTTAVMKETLRLFPIGWASIRETKEPVQLGDYAIPAKVQMFVNFLHMQRNPAVFDRPTEFIPERWLTPSSEVEGVSEDVNAMAAGTIPYSYLPFSGGMRSCIGKPFAEIETKMVAAMLVQRFDFRVEEPKEWEGIPACDLYLDGLTLRPMPHTVWVTPRKVHQE